MAALLVHAILGVTVVWLIVASNPAVFRRPAADPRVSALELVYYTAGVASVSAPVRSPSGKVIAAVSVSGPIERLSRQPGRMHAPAVMAAAERLSEALRRASE